MIKPRLLGDYTMWRAMSEKQSKEWFLIFLYKNATFGEKNPVYIYLYMKKAKFVEYITSYTMFT